MRHNDDFRSCPRQSAVPRDANADAHQLLRRRLLGAGRVQAATQEDLARALALRFGRSEVLDGKVRLVCTDVSSCCRRGLVALGKSATWLILQCSA